MRRIAARRSLMHFLEEIEYSEAALSADPDAAFLALPFQNALAEWETHFKSERAARRAVVRTSAIVGVRNERIDVTTIQFAAVARSTSPDVLDRCFTMAPGKFVRGNLRKQCETTKIVIVPEIGKLAVDHPCKAFGAQLDACASSAVTALDDRAQAMGSRQSVTNDVLEWKEGINALRITTYAELTKVAVTKGLPKSWVESFFRKIDDASDPDSESETPAEAINP